MLDSVGMTLYAIELIDRPNLGCTLDFCHMLMKFDSPAYGLAVAALKDRIYGLHMNDGYGQMDGGLIFGSINLIQCVEFVYYLKKTGYDGVVFFDTFPIRENPEREIKANIDTYYNPLVNGLVEDVDATIEQFRQALEAAGIRDVLAEMERQASEYAASKQAA